MLYLRCHRARTFFAEEYFGLLTGPFISFAHGSNPSVSYRDKRRRFKLGRLLCFRERKLLDDVISGCCCRSLIWSQSCAAWRGSPEAMRGLRDEWTKDHVSSPGISMAFNSTGYSVMKALVVVAATILLLLELRYGSWRGKQHSLIVMGALSANRSSHRKYVYSMVGRRGCPIRTPPKKTGHLLT